MLLEIEPWYSTTAVKPRREKGNCVIAPPVYLPEEVFKIPSDVIDAALSKAPQLDMLVKHDFADGLMARTLTIPAGTLLTSRLHMTKHVSIVSEGEITVWGDGVEPEIVTGHCVIVAGAGTRRIGYAHRTTIWTTIFLNPLGLTDPDAVLDGVTSVPELPLELLAAPAPEVLRLLLEANP